MTCHYCRTENSDDDHRCQRCGRRLQGSEPMAPSQPVSMAPYSRSSVAHALAPQADPQATVEIHPEEPAPQRSSLQYQRSLFSNRELPRVVQLERTAPAPATRPSPAPAEKTRTRARRAPVAPGQQRLDFPAPAASPRTPAAAPGSLIDCDALTATLPGRVSAFAFDATMILGASAIFLGVARFGMHTLPVDRLSLIVLGISVALIAVLYKALWCLGNGDSPGLHWARLRLVNFDGRRPRRMQRFQRAASGIVSFAAMGLGLAWALVDEEALTWHDHISKCFPTSD